MKTEREIEIEMTGDVFYNLQNIYEVIVILGDGTFRIEELINVIDELFEDFSEEEKIELGIKVLKIIKILK